MHFVEATSWSDLPVGVVHEAQLHDQTAQKSTNNNRQKGNWPFSPNSNLTVIQMCQYTHTQKKRIAFSFFYFAKTF